MFYNNGAPNQQFLPCGGLLIETIIIFASEIAKVFDQNWQKLVSILIFLTIFRHNYRLCIFSNKSLFGKPVVNGGLVE